MPRPQPSNLAQLLTRHGSKLGLKAFRDLVARRCDRSILGDLLLFLTSDAVTLPADKSAGRKRPLRIEMAPLDSWETALAPLTREELPRIAARAKKLLDDIKRLRRTRWIKSLVYEGTLPEGDLLRGSPVLAFPPGFWGLLNLPELAKRSGPRPKPEYTRRLRAIYKHIRERTGGWHDAKLADIVNDLCPDFGITTNGLKMWRKRHGLR